MLNKYKFYIIFLIIISLIIFFCYNGYYPFNKGEAKKLHYFLYDGYHIAFNISNITFENRQYYCKRSKIEKIHEYVQKEEQLIKNLKNVQNKIYKANLNKYNITDIDYALMQQEYDNAHIFKDIYYYNKAENLKKNLNAKIDYNKKLEIYIKELEDIEENLNAQINENEQNMLKECCVLLY